jgi:mono/diheme cytochrome c family protein
LRSVIARGGVAWFAGTNQKEAAMRPISPLPLIAALVLTGALAACVLPGAKKQVPTGAEDFVAYCAACHGTTGVGNGEVAATLPKPPANLTSISTRNGGPFPMARVMSKIWGYAQKDGVVMPQFSPLLDSDLVLFDSGDGIQTPTPLRLVQLAEYLKTLQK